MLFALLLLPAPQQLCAQREAKVEGRFTLEVSENDNMTIADAWHKCEERAKTEALKSEFGEIVSSDVVDTNAEFNGKSSSSYWESTVTMAKGMWLGNTAPPVRSVEYKDSRLYFTVEVKGRGREVKQSTIDLKWETMKDVNGKMFPSTTFGNKERIYVKFRSPVAGYLAVYLLEPGADTGTCMLPYRNNASGQFRVKANRDYVLFDKSVDATATIYNLTTKKEQESNRLIFIFSPNPFTKCNESAHYKDLSFVQTADFQQWLSRCRRQDNDMVVKQQWIKINGNNK